MKVNSLKRNDLKYPKELAQIADPPKVIYWLGRDPVEILKRVRVGIVGSRKPTRYGREVTYKLAYELASKSIVVVSGLAFGVDSIAHQATLDAGGITIAVLPSSVEQIYPASHRSLAQKIVDSGGTLLSEYETGADIRAHNFIGRNRIISALSDTLIITEAAKNSGSLHTANFALEQGKTIMAVPGPINSSLSEGTNNLIKSGAGVIGNIDDVYYALGMNAEASHKRVFKGNDEQRQLFELIAAGVNDQEELATQSGLEVTKFNNALTMLELSGYIRALGGGNWSIS